MRGRFITFEGGEGAGKSTQIRRLANYLNSYGISVLVTREPGGSAGAEAIRHVLLSGAAQALGPTAEAMLFAAARADHIAQTIEPALAEGTWVLCDRFIDSTRVYQGENGVDPAFLAQLEAVTIGALEPELTIIVDVPAELGLARIQGRDDTDGGAEADRFEREELVVHQRRRARFLEIASAEPDRCVVIDGSRDADTVASRIRKVVNDRLGPLSEAARNAKAQRIA